MFSAKFPVDISNRQFFNLLPWVNEFQSIIEVCETNSIARQSEHLDDNSRQTSTAHEEFLSLFIVQAELVWDFTVFTVGILDSSCNFNDCCTWAVDPKELFISEKLFRGIYECANSEYVSWQQFLYCATMKVDFPRSTHEVSRSDCTIETLNYFNERCSSTMLFISSHATLS